MISILCPTRGRPDQYAAMRDSALETATGHEIQIVAYLDQDDPDRLRYPDACALQITGPRLTLSETWNRCADHAAGDILMHAGDDIRFRTPGWDRIVEDEFQRWPDRIVLVHGDDGGDHPQQFGTHSFVHRAWVDAVGYVVPPYFESDMADVWLNELADQLGRRVKVDILTEHLHPLWGKGELDRTHRERLERHTAQDPAALYEQLAPERAADLEKLRAAIR